MAELCFLAEPPNPNQEEGDWLNLEIDNMRIGKMRFAAVDEAIVIYSIMVFPEYQRCGYGRQTIDMLKGRYRVIVADRVRCTATTFWSKMGFHELPDGNWEYHAAAKVQAA